MLLVNGNPANGSSVFSCVWADFASGTSAGCVYLGIRYCRISILTKNFSVPFSPNRIVSYFPYLYFSNHCKEFVQLGGSALCAVKSRAKLVWAKNIPS